VLTFWSSSWPWRNGSRIDFGVVRDLVRVAAASAMFDPTESRTGPDPRMPVAFQASLANATFHRRSGG
jgi:hypothetical protein